MSFWSLRKECRSPCITSVAVDVGPYKVLQEVGSDRHCIPTLRDRPARERELLLLANEANPAKAEVEAARGSSVRCLGCSLLRRMMDWTSDIDACQTELS